MRNLLSSQNNRIIKLTEYIYKNGECTLGELVSALKISNKTLITTIDAANKMIAPLEIIRLNDNKVSLDIPDNYSISYIYPTILSMSTEYIFLEMIFLNEGYTLEEVAEILLISPSTLRRIIKKINKVFEKEHMEVTLLPLKISGDESKVFNFLTFYLLEKYTHDEKLPFTEEQIQSLNFLLKAFEKELINLSYATLRRIRIYTMVRIIRVQNNNFIDFHGTSLNNFLNIPILQDPAAIDFFKHVLKIELTEQNIMQLFPIFFTGRYAYSYSHLFKLGEENPLIKKDIEHFSTIIDNLSKTFKIEQQNKEKMILELCNIYMIQYGKPYILYSSYIDFIEHIRLEYPDSLKLIERVIKKELVGEELTKHSLETYVCLLITNWENLYLEMSKNIKRIKMGIFYNTNLEHMRLIKEQISNRFPNYFQIEIIKHNNISIIKKAFSEYTILLTNITGIELEGTKVLCFPINIREKDWNKLMAFHAEFHVKRDN